MTDPLTHRLNQVLPKLTSDDFLNARGIGNEIAFYIFDYAPRDELRIREHIRFLVDHLPMNRPELRVTHVNLFDFLIHYLRERNLLEKSFLLQRENGDDALLKALKGILHEEKIAQRFAAIAKPAEHDMVLVSGVGSAYPLLRSHTLLSNLHAIMGQTPLVMFYPGRYDTQTLRLFGKTGLTGGSAEERKKRTNYYRAFRLID
ncbi:MAG: DUF1788 domain-containing protein [Bryobacterales bacterium]|nr:DUF1788 domain-containing protein [Bryobacterales bacterium]